jgi:hypothetical protein
MAYDAIIAYKRPMKQGFTGGLAMAYDGAVIRYERVGQLIEVDLTKRLRGRDRRAFDPREGQEIKFVKSRRPRAECPDPQRANALEPSLMCCFELMAALAANQRRRRKNFTRYRRQSAVDHIDSATEQI